MKNTVFVKSFPAPPVDRKEILRYLNAGCESAGLKAIIDECLKEAEPVLSYKVCYAEFPVNICEDVLDLCFCKTCSHDLYKNLNGCSRIILFAATVGIKFDILVNKYSRLLPSKALCLQAIGNERVESLCNVFNAEIAENYGDVCPRFSPGYGDLTLNMQEEIFKVLNCSRNIGLTLNDSLLMSPQKSVTAIIGIRKSKEKI